MHIAGARFGRNVLHVLEKTLAADQGLRLADKREEIGLLLPLRCDNEVNFLQKLFLYFLFR